MFTDEKPKLSQLLLHFQVMAIHPGLINNTVVTGNRKVIFTINGVVQDLKKKIIGV